MPLAGKYRLIDISISNCLNSSIDRIYVLTQFNSSSLNRHITGTYHLDPFSHGFVNLEVANQSDETSEWYQGTADARAPQHQDDHAMALPARGHPPRRYHLPDGPRPASWPSTLKNAPT